MPYYVKILNQFTGRCSQSTGPFDDLREAERIAANTRQDLAEQCLPEDNREVRVVEEKPAPVFVGRRP